MKNHLAIIIARGGSKRLPGKNIVNFFDKPLIAWTIEAAIISNKFEKVLVSTDDEIIAKVAIKYGAEVPFLRINGADDFTPSSEASIIALEQAENYWKTKFEFVSQLMPNCPLRDHVDIIKSIDNFINTRASSQISCFSYDWMNPWWAFKIREDNRSEKLFPNALRSRSQDLPKLYCPTGAIWTSKSSILKSEKTFYSKKHSFFPINSISAIDIDDENDLNMAKAFYLIKNKYYENFC